MNLPTLKETYMRFIKIISAILIITILLCGNVFAITLDEAFVKIKTEYPEFVARMNKGGATDQDIIKFISSAVDYMVKKDVKVTEENFDEVMMETMETVIYYSSNLPVYQALTKEFTKEAMYLVLNKEIPESLKPLYNAVKEIVLSSPELFEKDTNGSNGNTNGNTTGNTSGNTTTFMFNDCAGVPWAIDSISYLVSKNIVKGYDDGSFKPSQNITRAEFTKIIVSAFGFYNPEDKANFNDVSNDKWYFSFIGSAQKNGIINGYEGGSFMPDALITREDISVIVHRAAKTKGIMFDVKTNSLAFSDASSISDYAKESVEIMQRAGIINGMGDGTFAPKSYATRAQAAKIIFMSMQ